MSLDDVLRDARAKGLSDRDLAAVRSVYDLARNLNVQIGIPARHVERDALNAARGYVRMVVDSAQYRRRSE